MTHDPTRDDREPTDGQPRSTADRASANGRAASTTRRSVLKAAGAGAGLLASGASGPLGVAGQDAAGQIPTPWLHVDGNLIKDPLGEQVTLRGLNMADPKRIDVTASARGKTALDVVDYLTDPSAGWYPRVIRIPVQPIDIGEHEPGASGGPPQPPAFEQSQLETYLEEHLDPVVERCRERGVYAIVDFHRHWHEAEAAYGSEATNYYAHPDTLEPNEALQTEVNDFWETVAPRYAEDSHVLYEVYNEPTEPGMWTSLENDAEIWRAWKETAQPWVDTIREHADNLILVGSPSWSQSTDGIFIEEFEGENLAYTYHVYPGHTASRQEDWNGHKTEGLHDAHEEVPVVVTEFGWQNDIRDDYLQGTTSGMGEPFIEFLESHDGLHWTAWCADPTWRPVMFNRPFAPVDHTDEEDSIGHPYDEDVPVYCEDLPCDWSLLGRDEGDYDDFSGEFIRETLEELQDDGVPTVAFDDQPPGTPDPEVVDVSQTTMELSWDAVDNPGDSPFSHYNVYLDGELRTTVSGGTTSVTIEDVLSGKSFEVGVSAEDGTGNESVPGTVTVETEPFDDDAAPPAPDGLAVPSKTHLALDLEWDAVEDEGPAGLHHYEIYVDGVVDHTVRAGTTSTTVSDLTPDTTYQIAVSAVDVAQNESEPTDAQSVTTEVDRPREGDLLINDYDGDPEWPQNELGRNVGTGGFESVGVTDDDRLRIEYDGGGWFGSPVATDVSSYDTLYVRVVGDDGGEHEDVDVSFGPIEGLFADVGEGAIEQRPSLVAFDLPDDGDLSDPGEMRLGFTNGGSGAIEIDAIWLRNEDSDDEDATTPPMPTNLASLEQGDTTAVLEWAAVDGADGYEITVSGVLRQSVEETSATIEGLQPDSTYTIGVRAFAGDVRSELSTIEVTTTGEGGEDDPCEEAGAASGETLSDGSTVCDVDGDGAYMDVTGDGSVTNSDVTEFFGNQHADPWDSRADLFDFTGDDDVSQADVIELFRAVA